MAFAPLLGVPKGVGAEKVPRMGFQKNPCSILMIACAFSRVDFLKNVYDPG